jgi:CSLREA domain-containing protein
MKLNKLFIFSRVFIFTLISLTVANAADFTVTKSTNSNDGVCDADCSLREAVAAAQSGDRVIFNSNLIGQTFTLDGSPIEFVGKRIEIDGNLDGTNVVFLSGSGNTYHFDVRHNGSLTLKNMILANGFSQRGSILTLDGSIFLDRVAIRGNQGTNIGAIELLSQGNSRNHTITNSSITGNTVLENSNQFAAVFIGLLETVNMSNTTVSGNRTLGVSPTPDIDFGAIFVGGHLILRNCTITGNEGNRGGGIFLQGTVPATLDIGNSIVAENSGPLDAPDIYMHPLAQITSRGGNLLGDTDTIPGGIFNQTNDAVNLNPLLAPTNSQQGGHPVFTHPLQAGSPALNAGVNSVAVNPVGNIPLVNDGRGTGFPRIAGGTVDKGAFEDQSLGSTLVVSKLANSNDNVCDTDCSLREAVFAASQDPGTDNIAMAANVFGTMIVGTEIQINNHDVNIIGYPSLSSNTLIVSGNNFSRVFRCENANVTMTGFTIANGTGAGQSQPFGGGGMLFASGNLTLSQMIIRNNATVASDLGSGGGLAVFGGSVVRIMNSTINNNSSYASLGAKIHASVIYITNTTVANNSFLPPGEVGAGALTINGTLYMRNSTIANNRSVTSMTGSGLYCGAASTCNLGNNVFSDNVAANGPDLFVEPGGIIQSVGGNLVEDLTGYNNAAFNQPNDNLGIDPVLGALADNGGNVTTQALGVGSPAANRGVNANAADPFSSLPLPTDARGIGFPRMNGTVDKGAFESLAPSAAPADISGHVMVGKSGLANAIVTITDQHGQSRSVKTGTFGMFKFDDLDSGKTYIIAVLSKRYQFQSQVIELNDNISDLTFQAIQ